MTRCFMIILFENLILMALCLYYYSNLKETKELKKEKIILLVVVNLLVTIVGAILYPYCGILLLLLLIVDGVIWVHGEPHQQRTIVILKIVFYIGLMGMSYLFGMGYFRKYVERSGISNSLHQQDILLSVLLDMCLLSIFILYACQVIYFKDRKLKYFWGLLSIYVVKDLYMLHASAFVVLSNASYFRNLALYIPWVVVEYLVYSVLVGVFEILRVKKEREDLYNDRDEYYQNLDKDIFECRRLYHDMNKIVHLYEYSDDAKAVAMSMFQRMEEIAHCCQTGSSLLDTIVFNGKRIAKKEGTEFEVKIPTGILSFANDQDLSVLFSNAISNALEACHKIEEGEKKIRLNVHRQGEDITIDIENTVAKNKRQENFVTNKIKNEFHGFGLKSIETVAKKYGGSIMYDRNDQIFWLIVTLKDRK